MDDEWLIQQTRQMLRAQGKQTNKQKNFKKPKVSKCHHRKNQCLLNYLQLESWERFVTIIIFYLEFREKEGRN